MRSVANEVTLVEREQEIGGQLRAWGAVEVVNKEITTFVEFYRTELQRTGVEVRLGTEIAEADMNGYDTVLPATGTKSAGAPKGAIDAVQMLADRRAPEAQELTVHGDTETAMFAALWLAEQGRKVTLSSHRRPNVRGDPVRFLGCS